MAIEWLFGLIYYLRKLLKNGQNNMRQYREMHYTMVSPDDWPWKNFTPKEIACQGTGLILIDPDFMDKLQAFREMTGVPFEPNSAYRSESHNNAVGGVKNSYHRKGRACDVPIKKGMTREIIKENAAKAGFTGFGDYHTFVHIDTGRERHWDKRN